MTSAPDAVVDGIDAAAYTIPTDVPESDGTLRWDSTTIVVVEACAAGQRGLGYTYGHESIAPLVRTKLADIVCHRPLDVAARFQEMQAGLRNIGRRGIGMMAISAVDIALHDLHARLRGAALTDVLPSYRRGVPIYGSGGFTSYSLRRLATQLGEWVELGIPRVKMKIGRRPGADPGRLDAARDAIGPEVALFVDANGAYSVSAAEHWAHRLRSQWNVTWFEEPVTSDDVDGLADVRAAAPGGLDVTAGEYAFVDSDVARLLGARAVDCLQLDVTRCGGFTGVMRAAAIATGWHLDVSGHAAPNITAHALCAVPRARHLEYFHDHVRIEREFFEGALDPVDGALEPDRRAPGHGLALKRRDIEPFRVQ